jgi:integrase
MTDQSQKDWQRLYSDIVTAGTAKSTRRAYTRDVKYFWAWAQLALQQVESYPVTEEAVIRFVLEHLGHMDPNVEVRLVKDGHKHQPGPLKIRTLRRYLASLSVAHQEQGLISPTLSPNVKILLRRARQATANQAPRKKAAITRDILKAMLATCDDSLVGVRDRALLLVGFTSGGRRRDELAKMQIEDLKKVKDGYLLYIRKSKTDQGGKGLEVPILGPAAVALKAWLVKSGLRKGDLFRGIHKHGKINEGMSGRTVSRVVKRRVAMIGLEPDQFGAHSLRSGFITEAARSGANLADTMSLSGHRSVEVAAGYYRQAGVLDNPAGKLMND